MDLFRDERIKEMNNANTSINELANERATVADIKAKAQQEADKYNEVKNAIAEPLATSFLHPTAIKLLNNYVKPGVKKVLGRATQEVSEAGKTVASNLIQGRNPAEGLGEQLNRNLDQAKQAVQQTKDDLSGVSDKARSQLRMAKRRMKPSRPQQQAQPEADRPTQADSNFKAQSSNDLPSSDRATLTNIADEGEEDALVNALAKGQLTGGEAQTALQNRAVLDDFARQTGDLREGANIPESLQVRPPFLEQARASGIQRSANQDSIGQEQPSRVTSKNVPNEPDFRQGTGPEDSPFQRRVNQLGDLPSEAPKPSDAVKLAGDAEDVAKPAVSATLGTVAEDVEVAGGGPENLFTDVLSGILAIGSLIAGSENKEAKPVIPAQPNPINPAVQYGI
jgi:hypothetical protein